MGSYIFRSPVPWRQGSRSTKPGAEGRGTYLESRSQDQAVAGANGSDFRKVNPPRLDCELAHGRMARG